MAIPKHVNVDKQNNYCHVFGLITVPRHCYYLCKEMNCIVGIAGWSVNMAGSNPRSNLVPAALTYNLVVKSVLQLEASVGPTVRLIFRLAMTSLSNMS